MFKFSSFSLLSTPPPYSNPDVLITHHVFSTVPHHVASKSNSNEPSGNLSIFATKFIRLIKNFRNKDNVVGFL